MSETKKNVPVVSIIIATISLIVGFILGLFYQKSKTPSFSRNGQTQMGNRNSGQKNNGQISGPRQNIGEITKVDGSSITLKMADGSSKIVLISDSTVVNQSSTAAKTDLKVGAKISVMGSENTDGSITGKTIILNPQTLQPAPEIKP